MTSPFDVSLNIYPCTGLDAIAKCSCFELFEFDCVCTFNHL